MLKSWTLITVTFNNAAVLRKYWRNEIPSNVEWIVIDNGSSDDSVDTARRLGASRVIETGRNLGFGAANNEGLKHASHDYVAFVNPDVTVNYGDLPALADRIDQRGGLASPQLINDDSSSQPNGRGMPLLAHKIFNRISKGSQPRNQYLLHARRNEERFVFWLIGAVVGGRAETFTQLKGWNELFFLYYEDKDISVRAWRAGFSVVLCGQFQWTHGWARETTRFRIVPWAREISSLVKFYGLYPEFIFGGAEALRRNPQASRRSGEVLPID